MKIRKVESTDLESFNALLNEVCSEKKYLASIEGPSIESHKLFLDEIIEYKYIQMVAESDNQIIGWCDILPNSVKEYSHVGRVGMGVQREFRGRGLGRSLLEKCIEESKTRNFEKIELEVYSDNAGAVKLYESVGFIKEGLKIRSRKYDGNKYQDIVLMGMVL